MQIAARLAVSGSRAGCTAPQLVSLTEVLIDLVMDGTWELHHSDEVGVCQDAHLVWRACRQRVVIHPSTSNQGRALLDHDERYPSLPQRERDIHLAHETEALVHAPGPEDDYADHAVFRAARRLGRPIIIVLPSGDVQQWTHGLAPPVIEEGLVPPAETG